jgi:hypothetical protein
MGPGGDSGSGSGVGAWARREPAWARAAGSRRALTRLAATVTARMTMMTPSDAWVGISGTASDSVWAHSAAPA